LGLIIARFVLINNYTMVQKTKILTLILFGLLFSTVYAQDDSFSNDPIANSGDNDRKFRFGLQFNPNISWLKSNTSELESDGTKFSFSYGLAFEYFLSKNYLLSSGLVFSSLGGELNYEGVFNDNNGVNVPTEVNQTYNIRYIELPTILKLRTNEIGYMTYYGVFGLRTGIKYKSSSDFSYLDINGGIKEEGKNTASDVFFINTWLVVGAGAEYNLSGNTNISFGVTYNNGFINSLDSKVNLVGADGRASLDLNGNPVFTNDDGSANINYFSIDIAVYF